MSKFILITSRSSVMLVVTIMLMMSMAWRGSSCVSGSPAFDRQDSDAASTNFYEGRLPVHSSGGASFGTQLFTMDPITGAYTFGYDTGGGEHQSYRVETRSPDGTVTGRYGYVDPDGVLRIVDYVADRRGYRPKVTTRYPISRSSSFIGPIPSPILQEESRLKTRKIPFATPLLTASLFSNRIIIRDSDLILPSSLVGSDQLDSSQPSSVPTLVSIASST